MTCPLQTKNADVLLAYCSRKLGIEETALLDKHIETCAECRSMAEAQRTVWAALDTWEEIPVSADFDRRLYRRIEEQKRIPWWRQWLVPAIGAPGKPALALGAICATVFCAFLLKGPELTDMGTQVALEANEIDQAERVLEDLDMLKELGGLNHGEPGGESRPL